MSSNIKIVYKIEKNIFIFIISLLGLLCILYSIYLNYKISKVNEFKVNNNKIYIHTLSYGIKKKYNLNFEDIKDYQLLAEMNGWTLYIKTEQKIIKLQGIPYNNNEQCINILLKINEQSKK